MKKITVPILTEEYKIVVFLGKKDDLIDASSKYLKKSKEEIKESFAGRGIAFNCTKEELHPLILVDADLDVYTGFATLAHEASHAMDFIQSHLGINDTSGELHAHGIASVMRHCLKTLHKSLKKL
jgi:hypothetical protein